MEIPKESGLVAWAPSTKSCQVASWRNGAGKAEGALGCVEGGVRLTVWGLSAPHHHGVSRTRSQSHSGIPVRTLSAAKGRGG